MTFLAINELAAKEDIFAASFGFRYYHKKQ